MSIDEVAVYITKDHLGRAAMVRGADGFIRIYVHWIWAEDARETFRVAAGGRTTWETDRTPLADLYEGRDPVGGLYGSVDEARQAIFSLSGFADARLQNARKQ